ncbi:MAG: lipopolysaccharide biosynthesis protein [Chitinophagales bacterium]
MKAGFEKDTIYTVLVKIPTTVCMLIYMVLLTRLLGPEGNGIYTFVITNINIAIILLGLGTKASIVFFAAKKRLILEKILGLSLLLLGFGMCIMGLLVCLSYFDIGRIREFLLPSEYTDAFFLVFVLLVFLFQYLQKTYHSILTGFTHFKEINTYQFIGHLVKVFVVANVYVYCLYYELQCSIAFVFSWIILIECINTIVFTALFFRKIPFRMSYQLSLKEELIPFFSYGMKQYAYETVEYMNKRLDVLLIQAYRGTVALGQYGLATQVTNFMLELSWPINVVLFPHLTKMPKEEGGQLFCKLFRGYLLIHILFAVCIWGTADIVIPFVFGEVFSESILPMKLLAIGIVFAGIRNILNIYNKAYDRQRYSIIGTNIGLLATVFLGLWLIPLYGIIGAAYVSMIAYGLTAMFMFFTMFSHFNQPLYLLFVFQRSDWLWVKEQYQKLKERK